MGKTKKRPDGRVEIYRTIAGKGRHFYGRTKAEAERKYIDALTEATKGVLFNVAAEEWWGDFVEKAARNSLSCYKPAMERLVSRFGEKYVADITAKDMQILVDALAAKGYARKTIQTHLIVASDIFKRCRIEHGTETNPAAFVTAPSDAPHVPRDLPTDEEDALMMANARQDNFGLFLMIAKYAGLRRGEILGLRFGDIDRDAKTIRVERSVYYVGNQPHVKAPKTKAGIRTVPLIDALALILPEGKPNDYVFGKDQPLTNSRCRDMQDEFRQLTGIKATPHQFRHLYATLLYDAEIGAKDAQRLLGHAQFSTTMDIYTHVRDQRLEKSRNKLNALVNGKKMA